MADPGEVRLKSPCLGAFKLTQERSDSRSMGSSINTPCRRCEWRNSVLRVDTWSGEKSQTWKEVQEFQKRWVEGTLELNRRPLSPGQREP